jgi:transposase
MGLPKYRITLTEEERTILSKISRKHTEKQNIVRRAKMILRVDEGREYQAIAAQLGVDKHLVTTWIKRWLGRQETPIANRLQDLPRSGSPGTISPEQWCQIIALSCESPSDYDLPITDWTHRELVREAIKQGIVKTISPSHVGKMLKKKTYSLTEFGTG